MLRKCKSEPLLEYLPEELNGNYISHPQPISIFHKLHRISTLSISICIFLYIAIGSISFHFLSHQIKGKKTNGFLDSIYFCIVTITTVGYGDLVPNSVATKLLSCVFIFSGMAIIGLLGIRGADYLIEKQEMLLGQAMILQEEVINPQQFVNEFKTRIVWYKLVREIIFLLVLIVVGIIFLNRVEKMDFVDAFYCVCSTISTLGYGDERFSTKAGRVFAIFWILISTLCLARLFLNVVEVRIEKRRKELVTWIVTKRLWLIS
ncbi:hypothetical protein ACH5RR_038061 [Cinchona calisaya]|uniref:Potassium channel domain-containing protein n=1 Tax=Cinchona calisaya TaxID=153742 RepID=A0ABD2YCN3_9GENT